MVKVEYPRLFEDDAALARGAVELASRTFELSDLLVNRLRRARCRRALRRDGDVSLRLPFTWARAVRRRRALISHVAGHARALTHRDQCADSAVAFGPLSGNLDRHGE